MADKPLTLPEVAREVGGVEYRTLHSWLRHGLFTPSIRATNGTGNANYFSGEDVERIRWLVKLRLLGLNVDALAVAVVDPAKLIDAIESAPAPKGSASDA